MSKKAESRLQQRIQKSLRKEVGGKWFKVHGSAFQEAGQPDIIGTVDGLFFGFEIKLPITGKPSELQLETLSEYRDEGAIACIVETPSQAVALVKAAQAASGTRRRGDRLYRWICRTLRTTHGEDMGYGRSPRGGVGHNSRRTPRWVKDQLEKHLGEVPGGKTARLYGAP